MAKKEIEEAQQPAEKKPIEQWAAAKGYDLKPNQKDPLKRYALQHNCAKAFSGWANGAEVSSAEYEKAITDAMSVTIK